MATRRELQVFNFAFLDILTSTLGTLLFIFVMALVNQLDLVEQEALQKQLQGLEGQLSQITSETDQAKRDYQAAVAQTDSLGKRTGGDAQKVAGLNTENAELDGKIKDLQGKTAGLTQEADRLQEKINQRNATPEQGSKMMLPVAQSGSGNAVPIHVDCTKNGLIVLGANIAGKSSQGQRFSLSEKEIQEANGPYHKFLSQIKAPYVLVLWVRPDGIPTCYKALKPAKDAGVAVGYEPASADWRF